jgi:hypothetical protein
VQADLLHRNQRFPHFDALTAPDGDADLDGIPFDHFDLPAACAAAGMLKPDVVFFGEGVPKARVDQAMAALHRADAMLVVGSSLMVLFGLPLRAGDGGARQPIAADQPGTDASRRSARLQGHGTLRRTRSPSS